MISVQCEGLIQLGIRWAHKIKNERREEEEILFYIFIRSQKLLKSDSAKKKRRGWGGQCTMEVLA